jgi:hypothetical protein
MPPKSRERLRSIRVSCASNAPKYPPIEVDRAAKHRHRIFDTWIKTAALGGSSLALD